MIQSGDTNLMMAGYKLLSEPPPGAEYGTTPFIAEDGTAYLVNKAGGLMPTGLKGKPNKSGSSSLGQLISERSALPEGHPAIAVYDDAIKKATTHAPASSATAVSYGTPMPVYNERTGRTEIIQPGKGDQPPKVIEGYTTPEAAEKQSKMKSTVSSQDAKFDNLEKTINKALKNSGFWSTGIVAQMTSGIGNTPAKNLAATLETIKANMGFDELQEMRLNSPTGGALGQVAVQEIQYLQAVIASLDQAQSNEQLKDNLKTILEAKKASNKRIRDAYEQTYGTQQGKPPISDLWGN